MAKVCYLVMCFVLVHVISAKYVDKRKCPEVRAVPHFDLPRNNTMLSMALEYYVVEFRKSPYADIDKYVCVPDLWIKGCVPRSDDVIVVYPAEKLPNIDELVKNNDMYMESWNLYEATKRFTANSYNSAMNFIKTRLENPTQHDHDISKLYSLIREMDIRIQRLEKLKTVNDDCNSNIDTPVASSSKDVAANIQKVTKKIKKAEEKEEDEVHNVSQEDLNNSTTLILPSEYDPNDSKWTLRYTKKTKGLVKLLPKLPDSQVYIDEIGLKMCLESPKDCSELARMLLLEIFTENALKVCSLTGKKSNSSKTNTKPGLDENAVTELLKFVYDFGIQKNWKPNTDTIKASLRSKLTNIQN